MPKPTTIKVCLQCGYSWPSRLERPKKCPECQSRKWDEE
jgi:predicted Zn-ribbon and HTH transcriptional regulator